MKTFRVLSIVFIFLVGATGFAQETYTIEGKTYALKTEVEGPLTLLWNVVDTEYRYFAKKDNAIIELKNTRVDGKYQEEYKQTLGELTADNPVDASKTNLTLVSLQSYFNSYNKKVDPAFEEKNTNVALSTRLGAFAGMSNNNSTTNPENVFAPLIGIEFEVTDEEMLKRHALVLQFRYSFEAADYDLTYSQIALNYRYKFIKNDRLAVFAQAKLFTLTFSKLAEDNVEGLEDLSSTSVNTPVGLGLGMDYRIGNGFLTFGINDIVAPGFDTNGEFSIDVTLGYKFIL